MRRGGFVGLEPERPFNMAVIFLERINNRCDELDLAFESGDIIRVYRCCRVIYKDIYFKLQEKDIPPFDELFKIAENFLQNDNQKTYMMNITKAEKVLDKIHIMLYKKMYEYDLIFPHKKKDWLEEIEDDYKG